MRKVLFVVAAAVIAAAGVTGASAAVRGGGSSAQALRNPLGLTLVRFVKGTSVTQMQSAIQAAGGSVRLAATARKNLVNHMGPNNPTDFRDGYTGGGCPTGWCHIDKEHAIGFADAYGAGIVNAAAAVAP